jgi:hypothetical protein
MERLKRRRACPLRKTTRKTPHETKDNRTRNSLRALKHFRAGAKWTFWERIVGGSVGGFVSGSVGRFDQPNPHV